MKAPSGSDRFDQALVFEAARLTEDAAIAASAFIGRGDERAADQAAVGAMREVLDSLAISGEIVIGEGAPGAAPVLFVGERVGRGGGPNIDIALDPLEGVTLAAKAMPNALVVAAFAPAGGLLKAPDVYMDKIAVGPGYPSGVVDLDASPAENVRALAAAKACPPSEIKVCVLDRPRHADIIASLRSVEARVLLIPDGDVAAVISTTDADRHADLYLGQGGAPEGVLACAALKCAGGQFQGRLVLRNEDERARALRAGLAAEDLGRKFTLDDLVPGEAVFAATGVTQGPLLDGVRRHRGWVATHTLLMSSAAGAVREIRTRRRI